MKSIIALVSLAVFLGVIAEAKAQAEPSRLQVIKDYDPSKLVPIAINGFTGEVGATLKFDLEVAGFEVVPQEKAWFAVAGTNDGQVKGNLRDKTGVYLFNKVYQGGSIRLQTHALADDVVLTLTGKVGVAQTKILFRVENTRSGEIYLADYDGHDSVAVTHDKVLVAAPTWAPGNKKIYYTSYQVINRVENPSILSHDLSTGKREVFARHFGLNTSAAVSGDGRVAMILSKDGSPDVYVTDASGKSPYRVTKTREDESSPCWSADGQWLAFVTKVNGRRLLVKTKVGENTLITIPIAGVINPSEPAWSPDGQWIAFTAQMGGFSICVVPAQGGEAKVLTEGEDPSWAPNSRTIIFVKRGENKRHLSLLDVPTGRVKNLPTFASSSSQPAWAR